MLVRRYKSSQDELEVMEMIDFFYLQVQANDFVKEDGLKGPIGPMEMTVMVCRDNLATPEVRARLLEALQSNIGVWAGVSMKEFGDWNYPESIKTEGIWAKTLEKGDMDAFIDEYRVLCDGIDPVFSPAPQEKETSVKLIMKFMKSTSVDEVNKKKVKSGKWRQGLFTEQVRKREREGEIEFTCISSNIHINNNFFSGVLAQRDHQHLDAGEQRGHAG